MRAGIVALAGLCVVLGVAPGLLFGSLVGLAPWSDAAPTTVGLDLPGTGDCAADVGLALALVAFAGALVAARAAPRRRARADVGLRPARRAGRSTGRAPASRSRCGSCSRPCCGREREIVVRAEGGVVQEVSYSGRVPHLLRRAALPPGHGRSALARRAPRAAPADRPPRDLRRLPARARARRCSPLRSSGLLG